MLALSQDPRLRGRPMNLARPSLSQFGPASWRRPPQSRSPRAAESGLLQADSTRSPPCACGGGCPTCVAQEKLADGLSTAPALARGVPNLSATPAMQVQRMPAPATKVQSVDLGGGASVDAAQSNGVRDSQGGGEAEPAFSWSSTTMCPLSKATFLRSDGGPPTRIFYRVESGHIACTVFVEFGKWRDEEAEHYADLLQQAVRDPGSVCVKFDSESADPNCSIPRKVNKVWED